jgi:hypothetical protein
VRLVLSIVVLVLIGLQIMYPDIKGLNHVCIVCCVVGFGFGMMQKSQEKPKPSEKSTQNVQKKKLK